MLIVWDGREGPSALGPASHRRCYRNDMTRIDDYLSTVEAPKRQALERIRTLAKTIVPDAEDAFIYGMPTLTYQGKPFAWLCCTQEPSWSLSL
jgi:hypothetical protein